MDHVMALFACFLVTMGTSVADDHMNNHTGMHGNSSMVTMNMTTHSNDTDGHNHVTDGHPETGGHGSGHTGAVGHPLSFFFSDDNVIIFKEWMTNNRTFIPSCVGVALVAVFYEGLKVFREYLLGQTRNKMDYDKGSCTGYCSGMHFLQAFLHLIQTALSFGLMLVFMTYNVWLCVSVLIGAWLGYLLFAWTSHRNNVYPVNNLEHCM